MHLQFSSILEKSTYKLCVIFVCGQHPIFNNLAIDTARSIAVGDTGDIDNKVNVLMQEFGDIELNSRNQSLTFDKFMELVQSPSLIGRWFSNVEYDSLTKKQKDKLWSYIRKPMETGLMTINASNYKDIKTLRLNKAVYGSQKVGLLNLGYPPRATLSSIVTKLFNDRGIDPEQYAVDYFCFRMGTYYDDYETKIDQIVDELNGLKKLTYTETKLLLKDTENYLFDDFVLELTKPLYSDNVTKRRKAVKMLNYMLSDMSAKQLVRRLQYKVESLIEYRMLINDGIIPIMVKYSADSVKEKLSDKSKLKKASNYSFKKSAYIANQTSLKDWYFIKTLLSNTPKHSYSDTPYIKALLAVINRGAFPNDRLMNNLNIKNTLNESLVDLNRTVIIGEKS